jgi:hypothetical protein
VSPACTVLVLGMLLFLPVVGSVSEHHTAALSLLNAGKVGKGVHAAGALPWRQRSRDPRGALFHRAEHGPPSAKGQPSAGAAQFVSRITPREDPGFSLRGACLIWATAGGAGGAPSALARDRDGISFSARRLCSRRGGNAKKRWRV